MEPTVIEQIHTHLAKVPTQTNWGKSIASFLRNRKTNLAADYRSMMQQLKSQLNDCPQVMKNILGQEAFDFVQKLDTKSIPDDNLNLFENKVLLIKKALNRYNTREAATKLGISERSLYHLKPLAR